MATKKGITNKPAKTGGSVRQRRGDGQVIPVGKGGTPEDRPTASHQRDRDLGHIAPSARPVTPADVERLRATRVAIMAGRRFDTPSADLLHQSREGHWRA